MEETNLTASATENDRESFPVPVILGLSVLALVGSVANVVTAVKVFRSFDARSACFFLAQVDVASSSTCCIIYTVSMPVANLITRDEFACFIMYLSLYISFVAGGMITAEVSILRYNAVQCARRNEAINDKEAKVICTVVPMIYVVMYTIFKLYFGLKTRGQQICQGSSEIVDQHILVKIFVMLPMFSPIISAAFDVKVVKMIKNAVAAASANNDFGSEISSGTSTATATKEDQNALDDTVPVRATVASTTMSFLYMGISAMYILLRLGPLTRSSLILLLSTLGLAVRCPLMAKLTYVDRKRTKEAKREELQMVEIEHARAAREKQRRSRERGGQAVDLDLAAVRALTQRPRPQQQPQQQQQQQEQPQQQQRGQLQRHPKQQEQQQKQQQTHKQSQERLPRVI